MFEFREHGPPPDMGLFLAGAPAPAALLRLAARLAGTPIAVMTGPAAAVWCDPSLGPARPDRLLAFCAGLGAPTLLADISLRPELVHHDSVRGTPGVRFAAGVTAGAGVLWVLDRAPRPGWTRAEAESLADLAALAAPVAPVPGQVTAAIEAAVARAVNAERGLAVALELLCRATAAPGGLVARCAGEGLEIMAVHGEEPLLLDPAGETARALARRIARGDCGPDGAHLLQSFVLPGLTCGLALRLPPAPVADALPPGAAQEAMRRLHPILHRKASDRHTALLATALDRAADAVLITAAEPIGPEGPPILYANAAYCRSSGYSLSEVVGRPCFMLQGAGSEAAPLQRLLQAMRRFQPARGELRQQRKDGSVFCAELELSPIAGADGVPTHWIGIGRDVGERRRHEASFRMMFQDNPLPVVVVDQESLAFLEVNDAAVAQYGWPREEFLGRFLHELDPEAQPELARTLVSGRAGESAMLSHARADGSLLDIHALMHRTVHGGRPAMLAVLRDVTDVEAARRDMRHANALLRERTIQLAARTEELGRAHRMARLGRWRLPADPAGAGWAESLAALAAVSCQVLDEREAVLHPEDQESVRAALLAAGVNGKCHVEYRVQAAGEQIFHMRAEAHLLTGEAPKLFGPDLFGIVQDVTDRRRAADALQQTESLRVLGQLTGGVAHDFNNLLTVVLLNIEEAQATLPPDHPLQPVLAPALHAAIRGAELTAQLLAYARRAALRPEPVSPGSLLAAMRPLLARVLGPRHPLEVTLREGAASALADPAQLDSALMNLVLNARDAMPQGGAVAIETASARLPDAAAGIVEEVTAGEYLMIAVRDRGVGIPPAQLARVFEPFFTTKPAGKGSGMGLAMVYGFARQSGGHVTIDSVPGEGTAVRLYLPAAAPAAGAAPARAGRWRADGWRALLVEDQEDVRASVARLLSGFGFGVTHVPSAEAALPLLDEPFDLLLSDVVLPGAIDGLALAQAARRAQPGMRVLLASGFSQRALGAEAAAETILMKPLKHAALEEVLARLFPAAPAGGEGAAPLSTSPARQRCRTPLRS